MWKLCLTAMLAAFIVTPGCSDAPAKEKNAAENPSEADAEFDGKLIRRVGTHHYIAKSAEGTGIWYYPSGKKMTARTFRNGKLEGAMVVWYETGEKKYSVHYSDNLKNGDAKGWYKNGQEKHVIHYDHGKKHGKEIWYWENGSKKFDFTWYQGRRTAEQAWDQEGNIMKIPTSTQRKPLRQPVRPSGSTKKK